MIKDILVLMGAIFSLVIVGFFVVGLVVTLKEWIDKLKYNYQIRHRFDKPPTAKCYCVDCRHRNNVTGQCYRFGETTKEYRCVAVDWFCWEAEPRKKEDA